MVSSIFSRKKTTGTVVMWPQLWGRGSGSGAEPGFAPCFPEALLVLPHIPLLICEMGVTPLTCPAALPIANKYAAAWCPKERLQ